MTAKRFNYHHDGFGAYYLCDKEEGTYEDGIIGEIWADKSDMTDLVDLLNSLNNENEQLKSLIKALKKSNTDYIHQIKKAYDEKLSFGELANNCGVDLE